MRKPGEMIALKSDDGEVYLGFVTHVTEKGTYDCDLVADQNYRSSGSRCIKLANA